MFNCDLNKLATKQNTIINIMITDNNGLCEKCDFHGLDMQYNKLFLCFLAVFSDMSEKKEQKIEEYFGEGATVQRMGKKAVVRFRVQA